MNKENIPTEWLVRESQNREAVQTFKEALKNINDPKQRLDLLCRLGKAYRELLNPDAAIIAFQKAYEIDRNNLDVLIGLGKCSKDKHLMNNDDSKAINDAFFILKKPHLFILIIPNHCFV